MDRSLRCDWPTVVDTILEYTQLALDLRTISRSQAAVAEVHKMILKGISHLADTYLAKHSRLGGFKPIQHAMDESSRCPQANLVTRLLLRR